MNGIVENPLLLKSLIAHKNRIERTVRIIALYKCRTVSELQIALQKDLDRLNERIKEETK